MKLWVPWLCTLSFPSQQLPLGGELYFHYEFTPKAETVFMIWLAVSLS